jgi:hypothetical protein
VTLDRGLVGHYHVSGGDIGYERWNRSLTLDGVTADTLWMALKTKSAIMAGVRSMIVPGWGSFYDDHTERGVFFLTMGVAAGAAFAVTNARYHDRLNEYAAFDAAYQAASTPAEVADAFNARRAASHRVDDAWNMKRVATGAAIVVWSLSLIDAVAFVPRPVGPVLLGAVELRPATGMGPSRSAGLSLAMTVARVRF